ncbi:MAG: decaprenyl-phosphate phosphoribosyltransferase [Pseudomonadota bacterium]
MNRDLVALLRPKQWTKNMFVLAPLFFSGEMFVWGKDFAALAAVLLFSVISSAVYILNDICDLDSDRAHPVKRNRPLASGRVKPKTAWLLAGGLALVGLPLALLLNHRFAGLLAAYLAINIGYSLYFKHVPVLDAFFISSGFLLRVMSGGAVCGVPISHWILLCTLTLSLLLAFGKRREELVNKDDDACAQRPCLDGYSVAFLDQVISKVATLSTMCYLLYVTDSKTLGIIGGGSVIVTTLFVLFGMLRYLNLVFTYQKGSDPAALLLSDRPLLISCLGWAVSWVVILYWN